MTHNQVLSLRYQQAYISDEKYQFDAILVCFGLAKGVGTNN